jgi:2-polyprenylphenol 6-hydroxylase
MSMTFDVIVIGGGVVGLAAAVGMKHRGYSVAVLDKNTMQVNLDKKDPRVYAVNQASQHLLEQLDIWNAIAHNRVSPYRNMHVWDANNGASIDFDARMVSANKLGHIVEESVIKSTLLNKAEEMGIDFFPGQALTGIETVDDHIKAKTDKGLIDARLMIVADGGTSKTRDMLGVSLTSWPYHHHALVTTVEVEKPHLLTAYQVFNEDGPLAFLPLVDANQCSIVWSTRPKKAEWLCSLPEDAFNEALTHAFAAKLGACRVIEQRFQFPLIMRHVNQYCGNRWIVMGDAAHTIHPLAGLGLNVGLEDVAAWLNILDISKVKNRIISSRQLNTYQRNRKTSVWKIIALMQGIKGFFSTPVPPLAYIRGLGIKTCNRLPMLKRFFIGHAG